MGIPVAELQQRIDSAEFAHWQAYARMHPIGEDSANIRAGVIASAITNVYRKKGSKPLTWRDFFPPYETRKPQSNWRTLLDKAIAINRQLGGEDKRTTPAEE